MKLRALSFILVFLFLAAARLTFGQQLQVKNITTEFDGEKVIITYDLVAGKTDQKYNVVLKSSYDNYTRPLKFLMGDAGADVTPGTRNRVIWDVKNELPTDFNGTVTVKVEIESVKPMVESVALSIRPLPQNVYKRGSDMTINWVGGEKGEKLQFLLFRENQQDRKIADLENDKGSYYWSVPKKGLPRGNYFIRLVSTENPSEATATQIFTIIPRTPFLVKALPFVALGAIIYIIAKPKKHSPGPAPVTDLPDPSVTTPGTTD